MREKIRLTKPFRIYPKSLGRAGFTLVEVIIAVLLLATVAAGLLSIFVNARRLGDPGSSFEALFARQRLEQDYEAVRNDWWPQAGYPLTPGTFFVSDGTLALPNGKTLTRSYRVTSVDVNGGGEDYRRIVVQVTSS